MLDNSELQRNIMELPDDVRGWLSSTRVTSTIKELNARLNLKDEKMRVIPRIILRLVGKDVDPQDFTNTLALELGVSDSSAKIIAKEIEEKILHQIENSLRLSADVDVALLHFANGAMPEKIQEIVPPLFEPPKPPTTPTITSAPPKIEVTPRIEPLVKTPELPKAAPSGPFILHKEK